jgi:hypothetical protein
VGHAITLKVDRIRQQPIIDHQQTDDPATKPGTRVSLFWPDSARSILDQAKARFLQIANDHTLFNPHLTLRVNWHGEQVVNVSAPEPGWKKWLPGNRTSAHWYDLERFLRLLAAYLSHDADRGQSRTVRAFVAEFAGLSSTAKQTRVLGTVGLQRAPCRRWSAITRSIRCGQTSCSNPCRRPASR